MASNRWASLYGGRLASNTFVKKGFRKFRSGRDSLLLSDCAFPAIFRVDASGNSAGAEGCIEDATSSCRTEFLELHFSSNSSVLRVRVR